MARLEAVLLLADEPLGSRKIAQLGNLADGTEARTLVGALNRLYDTEGCAFRVVEVAGGFQLMSRAKFAPWLQRLHSTPVEVRLSAPAIETLAVVAYRQPVLRAEVEAIRGVQCGEILRQLMERDLVRLAGRSDDLGRPFLYGTTKRFLQVFGLCHLDQLPEMQWNSPNDPQDADDPNRPETGTGEEPSNQEATSSQSEQEPDVSSSTEMTAVVEEVADEAVAVAIAEQPQVSSLDDEEDEDLDDEDWDEDDEEDDDEEEEDEEEELEDDWEEVTDEDDEDEELEDEEDDEDDDWDEEEEGEDWDEDDEELDDWEEEEDDDWDEEEEEEKEEKE